MKENKLNTPVKPRLLLIKAGSERFAINVSEIKEVLPRLPITRYFRLPDFILGGINLRGNVFTVIDISKLLNFKKMVKGNHIIMVSWEEIVFGILIDEIKQLYHSEYEEHLTKKIPVGFNKKIKKITEGVLIHKRGKEEKMIAILSIERLLSLKQIRELREI